MLVDKAETIVRKQENNTAAEFIKRTATTKTTAE